MLKQICTSYKNGLFEVIIVLFEESIFKFVFDDIDEALGFQKDVFMIYKPWDEMKGGDGL